MRTGVLGLNYKLADLKLRERLAKICQQRLDPARCTHLGHSLILLSTCNRTEIYFSSEEVALTHSYLLNILRNEIVEEFDQKLYTFFGQDCLQHLCRVTAGLDSAVVAETEIQGQVKQAYERAHLHQKLPYDLHYLFQKSLNIAKKARGLLPSKPGLPDIEHAVLHLGEQLFPELQPLKILFVGASRINEKIIRYFKNCQLNNLTLCNRTKQHGRLMAQQYGIDYLDWESLIAWPRFDWVILATSSPEYLLPGSIQQMPPSQKLLIDLSVPRNADPQLRENPQLALFNIDQINEQLQERQTTISFSLGLAEELILHSAEIHSNLFMEKNQMNSCVAMA
jgi:glutamyl-tRNA reductase